MESEMTPWTPETFDVYDGWPARSWRCGRNRWLDGVMQKAGPILDAGFFGAVKRLAEDKSRAVSELAREVGLSEEKVISVMEKLGLTEITRFQAKADTKADTRAKVGFAEEVFRIGRGPIIY
jgi:hypothetical protein